MSNYNYNKKLEHRNNLIYNLQKNISNPNSLSTLEWYQTYMPFLPKEVLDILPQLEKEKNEIKQQEESLEYLKELFK